MYFPTFEVQHFQTDVPAASFFRRHSYVEYASDYINMLAKREIPDAKLPKGD
jgi:hypothetical protein